MKRFGTTICLAACLVFLCGAIAVAQDSVIVETKSVAANAVGFTVEIRAVNSVNLTSVVFPMELRTVSGGAYYNPATFSWSVSGRLAASGLESGFPTKVYLATPQGGNVCSGPTSLSWGGDDSGVNNHDGSPDAWMYVGVQTIGTPLAPGSDQLGVNSAFIMTMDGNGSPGDFEIDTMCKAPGNHLVFAPVGGGSIVPSFTKGVITLTPNACPTGSYANQAGTVGTPMSNPVINPFDAEGDPIEYYLVSSEGAVDVNTGEWTYTPTCNDLAGFTVEINITDKGQGQCANETFDVTVSPTALVVGCSDVSVHWGAAAGQQINASGGCPPYSYQVTGGPGSVDGSGNWSYQTVCADVALSPQLVDVEVTDAANQVEVCRFNLDVTNTDPECPVIPPTLTPQNILVTIPVPGNDADGDALIYSKDSGPAWADFNGNQIEATRPPGETNPETLIYTIFDGCSSVQCQVDLIFENPCIAVEDTAGEAYHYSLNGQNANIYIVAQGGAIPGDAGGFDFLVCYDASGLTFLGASQPDTADGGPGWEYFTYRTGMFGGNCGGGCPDGFIRLIGIADMNNGVALDPDLFNLDGDVLACLTFFVTSDRNFINSCLHVGFCSYDCGDNTVSDRDGDILWVPRFDGGVAFGPDYDCPPDPKIEYVREISFCGGAICVKEPPDDRGDLNLNGIANEIGDAVLYANYFIYGGTVWQTDDDLRAVQILSSDINDDGIVLTTADLIYLIRVITGDAQPFPPGTGNGSPKLSPYANSLDVITGVNDGSVTVRTMGNVEVGGALFVYRYSGMQVGEPELISGDGLSISSSARNGELRILVTPDIDNPGSLAAGPHDLVRIPVEGNGSFELVSVDASDNNGAVLSVNSASNVALPTSYALHQNYPNPFNAGTVIQLDLKDQTDWSLTVYNVAGQVVRNFSGNNSGVTNISWDGSDNSGRSVASGMYFYRAVAGDYTSTKTMVLLK